MKHVARNVAALAVVLSSALGCGHGGEQVVTAEVGTVSKMPFHGPGGPGSEPMSITFSWTVVVKSTEGPDCQVDHITTVLSEPQSTTVLTASAEPHGLLRGGGTAQFRQGQGGFFNSALYERPWHGQTVIDVTCSGRGERIEVGFTIP